MFLIKNIEEIIASLLLSIVVTLIFIQYVARDLFNIGFPAIEELLKFSFFAMIYFASSLSTKHNAHFQVNFIVKKMPQKARVIMEILQIGIWLLFNMTIIVVTLQYIFGKLTKYHQVTEILRIDMRFVFSIIPLAFLLQTCRLIYLFYGRCKSNLLGEFN